MSAGMLLQQWLVGLAVVASAAYLAHQRWPQVARRARQRLAMRLLDSPSNTFRSLGQLFAASAWGKRNAGPNCGACNACVPPGTGARPD